MQSIEVSEAVALQVRELVFSGAVSQLNGGLATVYALLASLVSGRRVQAASPAVLKRFKLAFERTTSLLHIQAGTGAAHCLQQQGEGPPTRDEEMNGMSLHEARRHLLLRWDKCNFSFDFGELAAAGGGAGGDPETAAAEG